MQVPSAISVDAHNNFIEKFKDSEFIYMGHIIKVATNTDHRKTNKMTHLCTSSLLVDRAPASLAVDIPSDRLQLAITRIHKFSLLRQKEEGPCVDQV